MDKGYYWVKHYNHSKTMAMYWNGEGFETFKSDEAPHDEIDFESVSKIEPPNTQIQTDTKAKKSALPWDGFRIF